MTCYWHEPLEDVWCDEHECYALDCPVLPDEKIKTRFETLLRAAKTSENDE